VESFILDQEDLDNPIMKTASELLLSSATDGVDLRTVDPETQARLEALLEAAGMTPSTNGMAFFSTQYIISIDQILTSSTTFRS
jgi:hypothetical protein